MIKSQGCISGKAIVIGLVLVFSSIKPLYAQWKTGIHASTQMLDIREQVLSPTRFSGNTQSLLHARVSYFSEKRFFELVYNQSANSIDEQESMDVYDYQISIKYLMSVTRLPYDVNLYGGLTNNLHFSYNNYSINSHFATGFYRSHEMSLFTPMLTTMLAKKAGKSVLRYELGWGFLSYGSRPEALSSSVSFNYDWFGPTHFSEVSSRLGAEFYLSPRFWLITQYHLQYYRYDVPKQLKFLKQSFSIGLEVKI